MKHFFLIFGLLFLVGCATVPKPVQLSLEITPDATANSIVAIVKTPTPIPTPREYLLNEPEKQTLRTGIGVKAVVISKNQQFVYSINLEDMSVYEFDRQTQTVTRKLKFVPHKGWGFNYTTKRKIHSYQEKPVEAHLTHNDRFLWISLHNAGGIVIWDLKKGDTYVEDQPFKVAQLYNYTQTEEPSTKPSKQTVKLLWIKTGKTPKVITSTHNGHWLYVANWHSHSVSVIDISQPIPSTWIISKNLKPFVIPRGMVVAPDDQWLLVAQMGSSLLSKVDINSNKIISTITIGNNPRHLVYDEPFLYISLNKGAQLLKFDMLENKIINRAQTARSPRTIALSKDNKYIFVVCYHANKLQVYNTKDLSKIFEFRTVHHPVAVDVAQTNDIIEVWVGNYSSGTIDVFKFGKTYLDTVNQAEFKPAEEAPQPTEKTK